MRIVASLEYNGMIVIAPIEGCIPQVPVRTGLR